MVKFENNKRQEMKWKLSFLPLRKLVLFRSPPGQKYLILNSAQINKLNTSSNLVPVNMEVCIPTFYLENFALRLRHLWHLQHLMICSTTLVNHLMPYAPRSFSARVSSTRSRVLVLLTMIRLRITSR